MYALVAALGFVLIYKASGGVQLRAGRDGVLCRADVRVAGRARLEFLAGARRHARRDGGARPRHRARGATPARRPGADHALHGHHRPHLRARGAVAAHLGLAAARPRARHPGRAHGWLSQKWNINISQFDLFAAFIAGALVAVLAVFFQKTRIGALRAGGRPSGGARRRHPAAAHLGDRLGGRRVRRAGGGLMWGGGTACSSRSPSSRSRRCRCC